MGYYVHIQVSWNGGELEITKPIAEKHGDKLPPPTENWEVYRETRLFFESVISGKSYFGGPKGDFWCWGLIGNHTSMDTFIELTKPFFMDLFACGELLESARVIYMHEPEDAESVDIYQLYVSGEVEKLTSEGKWFWGQY